MQQTPPIYFDSSAGDIMSNAARIGIPTYHNHGIQSHIHTSTEYQQNKKTSNSTGIHVQMGPINQPPLQSQSNNVFQQQQPLPMSIITPPAPTWETINNAFAMSQQQQQQYQQ